MQSKSKFNGIWLSVELLSFNIKSQQSIVAFMSSDANANSKRSLRSRVSVLLCGFILISSVGFNSLPFKAYFLKAHDTLLG